MELRDYLKVVRRRKLAILLVAMLVTGVVAALTFAQTPQYASNARLFISTSQSDDASLFQGGQFSAQRVKSYADLVTSRELAERVIRELDLDTNPNALASQASAAVVLETVNLTVTVKDPDPDRAQQIAQAYAEGLTDMVRELETPPGKVDAPIKATIVDAASRPGTPVSPDPVRNIGLGVLLGLMLGVGLALLRDVLDSRVKSTEEIAHITGAPNLGVINFDPSITKSPLVTQVPSHSPRAEAFRVLRTNLQFVDVDSHNKVFVVTSALPGEGKTSTSVNLAISLAQAGVKTVLVEGDLRRPRAVERLGLDGAVGITSVLVGAVALDEALQTHPVAGLSVIASGPVPPNPAELLQSQTMSELLLSLRARFQVVIIDAPPLLPVTDAALLAAKADGAILAVRYAKTNRDQLVQSVDRLSQVDAVLAGTVITMAPAKSKEYGYGYGYGYAPETVKSPVRAAESSPGSRRAARLRKASRR